MKREGKVSVRHGGKWVGCNILWVQMRRTASVEEVEGKKKKKSRCLYEHKVLPFGWKILNGHVQMSVYMISRSRSPNIQM